MTAYRCDQCRCVLEDKYFLVPQLEVHVPEAEQYAQPCQFCIADNKTATLTSQWVRS